MVMRDLICFYAAVCALGLGLSSSQGRDWFVRAGSTGGDGSKEKPFKDPSQALDEVEPGDFIHVTKGVYHGKLESGNWVISTPNLTWLGGYNDDFTKRDPWHNPTELRFSEKFRGRNYS